MFKETRATIVVSQPRTFSIGAPSARLARSHASWTASSASASDPNIRYATARRWPRCSSNTSASQPLSATRHISTLCSVNSHDTWRWIDVTAEDRAMKLNGLIVVTGGSGGLGRRVVARLRDKGRNVRVLSRHPGDSQAGVEYTAGDLETNQGVEKAISGAEIVVHCAGVGKIKEDTAQ